VVDTWALEPDGGPVFLGRHESLALASASLPSGSYTTLRTYGGDRLLRLEQHRQRLEDSLAVPVSLDPRRLATGLRQVLADATGCRREANVAADGSAGPPAPPESRVRLTFSPPQLFVSIEPLAPLPETLYRDGVRCVTVSVHRDNPHAKSTAFIATAARAASSLPPGIEEGLMLAEDGCLLEGLSSNLFAILDGVLRTEEDRVLPGITRSLILELADQEAVPVQLRAVTRADLARVSECFITSVSREILPVVQVDAQTIGDGRPGPLTRRLLAALHALVEREAVAPGA
jgi:branched-chain amino acid aminotransferase